MESNEKIVAIGEKVAVVGLGYVGLPLALEFAKKYEVIGFDINSHRIEELKSGIDRNREVHADDLIDATKIEQHLSGLSLTDNPELLRDCTVFIITVPTPTDDNNEPDLSILFQASLLVGKLLKKGDLVIYESTVYPGITENENAPILAKLSRLLFNTDFFCGYSPERINPGDKENTISNIVKITSGSTPEAAKRVDDLYRSIIAAGTYLAPSIKVAEAAKLMENAQRDINIAFMNEAAKIFNLLDIDTKEVLDAARTKWNFLKFSPGLVGGHCIGSAPNYLAHRAMEAGYTPEIMLAGRKMNDGMGSYVAAQAVKLMLNKQITVNGSRVLILGFTFKENCSDVRNTRVMDIVKELSSYQLHLDVYDPWADPAAVKSEYGFGMLDEVYGVNNYDAVILAVAHEEFRNLDIQSLLKEKSVVYDVKSFLPKNLVDGRL